MAAANFLEGLVCLDFDQMSILLVQSGLPIKVCEILSGSLELCSFVLYCFVKKQVKHASSDVGKIFIAEVDSCSPASEQNNDEDFLQLTLSSEDGAVVFGQVYTSPRKTSCQYPLVSFRVWSSHRQTKDRSWKICQFQEGSDVWNHTRVRG